MSDVKLPVLIDVDGVITDSFYEKCCNIANERFFTNYKISDFTDDLRKIIVEWDDEMDRILRSPGFCSDFVPIEGSLEWVNQIKERSDVKFVTSPLKDSPTWGYDRTKWLEEHFGVTRDDVILCHDKRYVSGVVLIDDLPKNCVDWAKFNKRTSLIIDQPWNRNFLKNERTEDTPVHKEYHSPWRRMSNFCNTERFRDGS